MATTMAGFVRWLAGQRVPPSQRSRVHREVERFLVWRNTQFPRTASGARPAAWCYLLRRRRSGDSESELLTSWGALELFLSYVEPTGVRTPSRW